ncbi:MAG TPA: cytochrome c peroxidase, partial [Bdellovibrionales bacterium]|nr:cytochrome c peroxidase [Bdellovibrionales bacterium]
VFRPEAVTADAQGYPVFGPDSMSPQYLWMELGEPMKRLHIGFFPNNDYKQNPFPSNAEGKFDLNGGFETYEIVLIAPVIPEQAQMEIRKGQFIIGKPKTKEAYVHAARFHDEFRELRTAGGKRIRGLEPSVSFDGHLLVYQGHPQNDGTIDTLVYSYNQKANSATGWSEPRSIADMYHVDRNVMLAGLPFHERYPLAKKPLRDMNGQIYAKGDLYQGAYPWISLDGTEVFHTSFVAGCTPAIPACNKREDKALRGGLAVIGRWTNYTLRLVDSPANIDRFSQKGHPTVRTLTSALGAWGTMWQVYNETPALPFPYSSRRPLYAMLGNVRTDYSEVSFEDAMDGHYALYLHMNEFVARNRPKRGEPVQYQNALSATRTPDTSPNSNHGTLKDGAAFPQEHNGRDENLGRAGQAIYFTDTAKIEIPSSPSLARFERGLTLELWVKREADLSREREDRQRYLLRKSGSFSIFMDKNGNVQAGIVLKTPAGTVKRSTGPAPTAAGWTHVAFTYGPKTGRMKLYVNGALAKDLQAELGAVGSDDSPLIVGPGAQVHPLWPNPKEALFMLDEVKISNVVRTEREIKASAYLPIKEPAGAWPTELPAGLKASALKIPQDNLPTAESTRLGERLFFDTTLSKNRDMSCATCHRAEKAFTDGLPRAKGFGGHTLRRNTPTILNRAFSTRQFWDGSAASLEEQALMPIENPEEMN